MIDWLLIPFGLAVAIAFFRILEDWSNIVDRLHSETQEEDETEWPHS